MFRICSPMVLIYMETVENISLIKLGFADFLIISLNQGTVA